MSNRAMMIDVQCSRCNKRFGWSGKFGNRPPCPRCSWRPPQEELDAIDARMEADCIRRKTDPLCASGEVLRQQRVDAGLVLRQAAELFGISPSHLSAIEQGREPCGETLAAMMREVYGVGPDQ